MIVKFQNNGEVKLPNSHKIRVQDTTHPHASLNPFTGGTYYIFGEKREEYVEQLSDILKVDIIEKGNIHIRIKCQYPKLVFDGPEKLSEIFFKCKAIIDNMRGQVEVIKR